MSDCKPDLRPLPGGKAGKPRKPKGEPDFIRTRQGEVRAIPANVERILRRAPWSGVLRFDEFSNRVQFATEPPWEYSFGGIGSCWTDVDSARLASWVASNYEFAPSSNQCLEAVIVVAREHAVHVVRDWLAGLTWDGVSRIDSWLSTYVGAEDTSYTQAVGACWLVSAVARVMTPGCQVDHVPIFESRQQGAGKSTMLRTLFGDDWFTDDLQDIKGKEAAIQLAGVWGMELAELDPIGSAGSTRLKGWISRRVDRYRAPFDRIAQDHPRQCVFAGTTNEENYLRDVTGARRFWPVKCGEIDIEALARDRKQLWAEAYAGFLSGRPWWPDRDSLELFRTEAEQRFDLDEWENVIVRYLAERTETSQPTTEQLLLAIGVERKDHDMARSKRVGRIMRRLGYDRNGRSGTQRAWRKVDG